MISIGSTVPGADELTQLTRTRDAENQRNSWLREMELAQLSEMGKLDTAGAWSAGAEPSGSSAWQSTTLASFAAVGDRSAQADTPATEAAQQAPAANRHDAESNAAASDGTTAESGANHAAARSNAIAAQDTSNPEAVETNLSGGRPAATASSLPGTAALAGVTPQAAAVKLDAMPALLQTAQPRAVSALPSMLHASGQRDAAATQEQTQADEPAGADPSLDDKPSWEKRLMHVTGEGQDVDVWIRDSTLGANQSLSLAYRLAGDIAGMGLRLRGATVNGKPLYRAAGAGPSQPQNHTPTGQDTGIGTRHSTIANTEEDHGA